jgi:hypothetical protein
MATKSQKSITTVREHTLHVPVSEKNPSGITIRDQHPRFLLGIYLKRSEIGEILKIMNARELSILYQEKFQNTKILINMMNLLLYEPTFLTTN